MDQEGRKAIIDGIEKGTKETSETLVKEAEKAAADRLKAWEEHRKTQLIQAEEEAERQAALVKKTAASSALVKKRRLVLKAREDIRKQLIDKAVEEIEGLIDKPEYSEILEGWITEAALGMMTPTAVVSASLRERKLISEDLLRRAEKRVKEFSGRDMHLELDSTKALPAQGVVLTSPEGNVAFSNQVSVRVERYQSEIRQLVHSELFKEE